MEDFVTFEIAKKLKEKGFKEQCLSYYTKDSDFYYNTSYGSDVENAFKSFNSRPNHICGKRIDAPIIYQVLKWLRDEKKLHIEFVGNACGYLYIVSDIPSEGGTDRYCSDYSGPNAGGTWDKYEDCALNAIQYVLDNLI